MATRTYVKPILPKIYPNSKNEVRNMIRAVTKRVCDVAAEDFRFLFDTWNHKPFVKVEIEEHPNEIIGRVYTEDEITFYLDGGTKTPRWALMSPDFQPKTHHRNLRSGTGQGGVVIRGRKAMLKAGRTGQPGIAARDFSGALLDKYIPPFEWGINRVMNDAINKGKARP